MRKAGFHQGVPGLRATDAVNPQTPEVLEGLHRSTGTVSEDAFCIERRAVENGGEPALNIRDGSPSIAYSKGKP